MGEPTRTQAKRGLVGAIAAYGAGDAGFLIVWQGASLFLLYFYTEVAGLPVLAAGLILMIGLIWDAVSDPIFAAFTERRVARGTPYTRLIVVAAPLVGLSYAGLYFTPDGPLWAIGLWALFTQLLFRTSYTLASMPYNALPARLSMRASERSRFTAARVVFAALGGLTVAAATPAIVSASPAGGWGYLIAAFCLGALASTCLLITGLSVRPAEGAPPVDGAIDRTIFGAIGASFSFLRANAPLQRLLWVMIASTLGFSMFSGVLLFFIETVPGPGVYAPLLLATPTLASLLAAPLWAMIADLSSKRTALALGAAAASAGFLALAVVSGPGSIGAALAVAGAGMAAIPVMLWSMAADAVDFGHLQTGSRVEARVFGLFTFVQKTAGGIALMSAAAALALIEAGVATGATTDGPPNAALTTLVSLAPAGLFALTALIVLGYPISARMHADIAAALRSESAAEPGGDSADQGARL